MAVDPQALRRLAEPFRPDELDWRIGRTGRGARGAWAQVLAYQTSRAVMDRFDAVCGPEHWTNRFRAGPDGGVLCRIAVHVEGAGWIAKEDGAPATDIEAVKGGLSGAIKRAAVLWGCGRYLYRLEQSFALVHPFGRHTGGRGTQRFRWNPPALPDWALPPDEPTHAELVRWVRARTASYDGSGVRTRIGGEWVEPGRLAAEQADLLERDYYLARDIARALGAPLGAGLEPPEVAPAPPCAGEPAPVEAQQAA